MKLQFLCRVVVLALFAGLFSLSSSAQVGVSSSDTSSIPSLHSVGSISLGGFFDTVYDRFGNSYPLLDIAINDTLRAMGRNHTMSSMVVSDCGGGSYFKLYLESGCGFDTDPAALAVLCQVCQDLSAFIHSPCGAASGQYVNIWVRNPANVGMPSSALGMATSFMFMPSASPANISGITDNTVWETINSGKDAYLNLINPMILNATSSWYTDGSTFFHGYIAFNLGAANWNTSLSAVPGVGQNDLYTTILHEMMHSLGFSSNINYNGTSRIGHNYFTRYDMRLKTAGGTSLITNPASCNGMYNYSFNPAISSPGSVLSPATSGCSAGYQTGTYVNHTNCSSAIKYFGDLSTVPVYTPDCYEPGSSLSHFEDECYLPSGFPITMGATSNDQYFVMSNVQRTGMYDASTNPGAMKRALTEQEKEVLDELNYDIESQYGDISSGFHNYHYYGYISPLKQRIVGFNDGITTSGTYAYTTTSGSTVDISYASLTLNDVGVTSVTCPEVVIGVGTITTSSTGFTYHAGSAESGIVLLRYIPLNSYGVNGNITYVIVYVQGTGCVNTACNLLPNGDFENSTNCGSSENGVMVNPINVECWSNLVDYFHLLSRGCTNYLNAVPTCATTLFSIPNVCSSPHTDTWDAPAPGNDHMILLISPYWYTQKHFSAIQAPLNPFNINPGGHYRLTFQAKIANSISTEVLGCWSWAQFANVPQKVQIAGSIGALPSISAATTGMCTIADYPSSISQLGSYMVPANNTWNNCSIDFVYTGTAPITNFIVATSGNPLSCAGSPGFNYGILIDHLSLTAISATLTLPTTIAACGGVICDLSSYASISGGTWAGPGVYINSLGQYCFNASQALDYSLSHGGTHDIQLIYTYVDAATGCVQTAYCTITVTGFVTPVVYVSPAGPVSVCAGSSVILTANITGGSTSGITYTYSWLRDGIALGITTATYSASTTGYYSVIVHAVETATGQSCDATSSSVYIQVNNNPSPITGSSTVCQNASVPLASSPLGGDWSSPNIYTSVDATGIVSGISAGTETITYTLSTGCHAYFNITVIAAPVVSSGISVCASGGTAALSPTAAIWTTSSTNFSITSTGVVTGSSAGTGLATYTSSATGCSATVPVIVNPAPIDVPTISGDFSFCAGANTILTSSSLSNNQWYLDGVAIPGGTGHTYLATTAGVYTVRIIDPAPPHCPSFMSAPVTVIVNPVPGPISGPTVCGVGSTIVLSDATPGGSWSSNDPSIAIVVSPGVIQGAAAGTVTISYILPTGCYATTDITVYDLPGTPVITASATTVCAGTDIILTSSSSTGNQWYLGGVAITGATGNTYHPTVSGNYTVIVTDAATGLSSAASTVVTVTINPLPGAIAGPYSICGIGSTATYTDGTATGTWSSSDAGVLSIVATTGVATAVSVGTATLTYMLSTGCYITLPVTVSDGAPAILGGDPLCVGNTDILSNSASGGTWSSSSAPAIITFVPSGSTCSVLAVAAGTATVTYTLSSGCYATVTIPVNPNPVVDAGFDVPLCPSGSASLLATVTSGTAPFTYSWDPATDLSAADIPNPVATPPATTTYLVTVIDANGCSSSDEVAVYLVPPAEDCPCNTFYGHSFYVLGLSGSISDNVPPGNYYIPNDVAIDGDVTFNRAVVMMKEGITVYVKQDSKFTLRGSHLFSCGKKMWSGIVLLSDDVQTGVVKLLASGAYSTLVEDARTAIYVEKPVLPTGGEPYFINSNEAIFNKNTTGIFITGHSYTTASSTFEPNTYRFHIENTVFTSRTFELYSIAGTPYPYRWPRTTGPLGLKTFWNPTPTYPVAGPYMPPYNIINPNAGGAGIPYNGVRCNDQNPALYGIYLNDIGTGSNATPYFSFVAGNRATTPTGNDALNLFDSLGWGIYAQNANFIVRNSAFMDMRKVADKSPEPADQGAVGIYARAEANKRYQVRIEPDYYPLTGRRFPNYFYDNKFDVYVRDYFDVLGDRSNCYSSQTIKDGISSNCAIKVQSGKGYRVELTNNYVYNIAKGIWVVLSASGTGPGNIPPAVKVNQNRMFGHFNSDATGEHYIDKAITVENLGIFNGCFGCTIPQTNINDNYMRYVYNGILARNISPQVTTTTRDSVLDAPDYPATMAGPQYGIDHDRCVTSETKNSIVEGSNYQNDNFVGILSAATSKHTISCNTVGYVGQAFKFHNVLTTSTWTSNDMYNSGKGFVMSTATIGTQGNALMPIADRWLTTGTFAWNLSAAYPTYQTYTMGSTIPTSSTLFVKNAGITKDPTQNYSSSFLCARTYGCVSSFPATGSGNGLNPVTHLEFSCSTPIIPPVMHGMEHIALAGGDFSQYNTEMLWAAQDELWREMKMDDTLGNSSDTLVAFRTLAAGSRYRWFTDIEHLIESGDYDLAGKKLVAYNPAAVSSDAGDPVTGAQLVDGRDADDIASNYVDYYRIYLNYLQDNIKDGDRIAITSLAEKCAVTGGPAVYHARALYDAMFDTIRVFTDDCPYDTTGTDTISYKYSRSITAGADGQSYQLHPNPNNGTFTLRQATADDKPVSAEVFDMMGRLVYTGNLTFTGKASTLSIGNVVPGAYLVKLQDTRARIFTFRFIVQ